MKRFLIITLALVLLGTAALAAIIFPGLLSATTSTWTASSAHPVSDRFLYAMFPAGDGSEFAQFMTPRLVLNAHHEVHDGSETYRIFDASGSEHLVPKSALTFEPSPQMLDQYCDALNETIAMWGGETDYRSVAVTIQDDEAGSLVLLTVIHTSSEHEYEYSVISGFPTPIRSALRR